MFLIVSQDLHFALSPAPCSAATTSGPDTGSSSSHAQNFISHFLPSPHSLSRRAGMQHMNLWCSDMFQWGTQYSTRRLLGNRYAQEAGSGESSVSAGTQSGCLGPTASIRILVCQSLSLSMPSQLECTESKEADFGVSSDAAALLPLRKGKRKPKVLTPASCHQVTAPTVLLLLLPNKSLLLLQPKISAQHALLGHAPLKPMKTVTM